MIASERPRPFVVALVLLALPACRNSTPALDGGATATPASSVLSSPAPTLPPAPPLPPRPNHGTVTFFHYRPSYAGGSQSFQAVAAFFRFPAEGARCARGTTVGSCCYTPQHPADDAGAAPAVDSDAGAWTPISAGAVALTRGTSPMGALAVDATDRYPSLVSKTAAALSWSAGDTLSVAALGTAHGIHKFSGSVKAVAVFAGVTPPVDRHLPPLTGGDLVVSWIPDHLPGEAVYLTINDPSGHTQAYLSCAVADSVGSVTAPHALLAHFTPGDRAFVQLRRVLESTVVVDNATIAIESASTLQVGAGSTF